MNTKRCIITTVLAAALLVSMAGTAFAVYANAIWTDPTGQMISVGEVGTYTVYVNTSQLGEHTIGFSTFNSSILANLTGNGVDTGALAQTGSGNWTPTAQGEYTFTYTVEPQSNAIQGHEYPMQLHDGYADAVIGPINASVIISTTIVPELTTFALVGIGLVGLVALGRRKK